MKRILLHIAVLVFFYLLIPKADSRAEVIVGSDLLIKGQSEIGLFRQDEYLKFLYQLINEDDTLQLLLREPLNHSDNYGILADFFNNKAIDFFEKGEFKNAELVFYPSLYLYLRTSQQDKVAFTLNFLGTTLKNQAKFEEAIQKYLQALSVFELMQDYHGVSNVYNNIGVIYNSLEKYDQALNYFTKSLKIKQELNHQEGIAAAYSNIAIIYNRKKKNNKALEYHKKALVIYENIDYKNGIAIAYNNIASVYLDLKDFDKSLEYSFKSYNLNTELEAKQSATLNILNVASVYNKQQKYADAKIWAEYGLERSKEMGTHGLDLEIYKLLINIYEGLGDYKKALNYMDKYVFEKDSLMNIETKTKIDELDIKYETQKKEAQIERQNLKILEQDFRLNRRNFIIILIVFISLLIIGIFLYIFVRFRIKKQQQINSIILAEEKRKTTEIIDAVEEERKRIARELHDGIGQNLANIKLKLLNITENLAENNASNTKEEMNNAIEFIDETYKETRNLSHQMIPKTLLYLGLVEAIEDLAEKLFHAAKIRFNFEHNLSKRFEQRIEISLFRIIQELINNIIKHAKATEVDISLLKTKDQLILIVEDNGIGLSEKQEGEKGIGLLNIEYRAKNLGGSFNISSQENKGCSAILRIPLKKTNK